MLAGNGCQTPSRGLNTLEDVDVMECNSDVGIGLRCCANKDVGISQRFLTCSYVLLDVELLHGLASAVNSILLHVFRHVSIFNDCLHSIERLAYVSVNPCNRVVAANLVPLQPQPTFLSAIFTDNIL